MCSVLLVARCFPKACQPRRMISFLAVIAIAHYSSAVKATLTSKGQITIPVNLRSKFQFCMSDSSNSSRRLIRFA